MVKRLRRLGKSSSLARLFYLSVTLLLFWLFSPGVPVVRRRQRAPQKGQVSSCHCSGHLVEKERQKDERFMCEYVHEYMAYRK